LGGVLAPAGDAEMLARGRDRLRSANIVRQMPDGWRAQGGRPTNLWEVNPALVHA
jgi:hypothetical protein